MERSTFLQFTNGSKSPLPFTEGEYENRLKGLKKVISENNLLFFARSLVSLLKNQGHLLNHSCYVSGLCWSDDRKNRRTGRLSLIL